MLNNKKNIYKYIQNLSDHELYSIILNLPSNMPKTEPKDTELSMTNFLQEIIKEVKSI